MRMGQIETRGSVLLGGAVALSAAGLLRVDGVLMALGCAAAVLLLLCWVLAWMNLRRLRVGIEMPRVVQAGVPMRMRVTIENGRRMLDAFGLGLEIKTPGGLETECQVPWVPAGSAADAELREDLPGRGYGERIGAVVSSRFPLGLFRFSVSHEIAHPLLVLPHASMPRELVAIGSALEAEPRRTAAISEAIGEPRGLREYRAGDPAKVIAWPASVRSQARGGGLMVRELDPPGFHPQKAVIVFHSFATDGALIRPDRFERAISLVWGAMRHFQASGVPTVLLADFEEWVPRRVATRQQLGQAGEMLAKTKRAGGTEEHELLGRLEDLGRDEALVVISDMPAVHWKDYLGRRSRLVLVDIVSYERKQRERRGRA
ncbi:DUF58 domain-containing protein [Haloferula chungangensis]|uniref:DUF58 domain-containing protein n=1 Tax=Haloferula chungangensis TaxID=1048331 RepID=A0ABW2LBN5_9BACT